MEDIGRKLLENAGASSDAINEKMIEQAIEANDAFIEQLGHIIQSGGFQPEEMN